MLHSVRRPVEKYTREITVGGRQKRQMGLGKTVQSIVLLMGVMVSKVKPSKAKQLKLGWECLLM